METKTILITGASGEVGHGLIEHFAADKSVKIVALDMNELSPTLLRPNLEFMKGDILDSALISRLTSGYRFDCIFHLAALLSTSGEKDPLRAHRVNVEGSLNMLEIARAHTEASGKRTVFIFPSTIAVYGLSSAEHQNSSRTKEDFFLNPITIYGANKLYVERLGCYYSDHFRLLSSENTARIDFRAVRFPGLISAETMPTGGTSDYGAEILHSAVKGQPYECFVTPEATLPFMVMPDAVRALVELAQANPQNLSRRIYNVNAFSVSAAEIHSEVKKYFPGSTVSYKPHQKRLSIVESWPKGVDDSAARSDWGWKADLDFAASFEKYLIPGVMRQYGLKTGAAAMASCH